MINVYDDFFSEEIREEIWKLLTLKPKWSPTGGRETNWFWHIDGLEKESYFNDYLYNVICNKLKLGKKYQIKRIYANGQSSSQIGNPHKDDADFTFLYYPNPEWSLGYGGSLIFSEDEKEPTKIIGYRPNRAILFPSDILHYVEAPHRYFIGLRISLAYKLRIK